MDIKDYCKKKGYSEEYAKYWEAHKFCELCTSYSSPPHHIKTRGAGGVDDPSNLLALCLPHHNEVHNIGWKTFGLKYPKVFMKMNNAMMKG